MTPGLSQDRPIALITGTTSGIGLALAEGLVRKGFHVVMHARSEAAGERPLRSVRDRSGGAPVDGISADLGVQAEVHALAQRFLSRYDRLDVLVHNAGVYRPECHKTPDGIEETFAVNHLAPFLLTRLLWDLLERTGRKEGPSRIVTVASSAHHAAAFDPEDPELDRGYRGWRQYCNTKLMNILWTRALSKRADPTCVIANTFHPGIVRTRLARSSGVAEPLFQMFGVAVEKGADTGIWLATDPSLVCTSGAHFGRRKPARVSSAAADDALAERLWAVSEAYLR